MALRGGCEAFRVDFGLCFVRVTAFEALAEGCSRHDAAWHMQNASDACQGAKAKMCPAPVGGAYRKTGQIGPGCPPSLASCHGTCVSPRWAHRFAVKRSCEAGASPLHVHEEPEST